MGKYFADHVAFLHMNSRTGMYEWALWLIPAQAGVPERVLERAER